MHNVPQDSPVHTCHCENLKSLQQSLCIDIKKLFCIIHCDTVLQIMNAFVATGLEHVLQQMLVSGV